MFLLPSLAVGLVFAVLLGGEPSRLAGVRFRWAWTVPAALMVQVVLFSPASEPLAEAVVRWLHAGTYGFLIAFAIGNLRARAFAPVLLGLLLNAAAIIANAGRMPLSRGAAEAVGLSAGGRTNVSDEADRLRFLGDVFALPSGFPLSNVFSVGDLLIGFGAAVFIVVVSTAERGERVVEPRRLLEPLRSQPYRRLSVARLVSMIGDWLTVGALVGWIYADTHSTGQVAGLLLARLAPPVLGGGVAALVVDRVSKTHLLVAVELVRALAVAGALVGVVTHQRGAVLAGIALSGALSAVSAAAVPAMLPSLLPAEQLAAANAELGLARNVARAAGAAGAGLMLSFLGAPIALLLDLATFLLAAALLRGLRVVSAPAEAAKESLFAGIRYLLRRRRLLLLAASFAAATLATGVTHATLPRFLDELGMGAAGYGFGMAALGTGLGAGELLVGLTRVGPGSGRWIGAALLLMAGLFGLLAAAEHAPTALLILFAIGFIDGTTEILFDTIVQREADPAFYGSVFGFASSFLTTTMLVSIAVAPLANQLLAPGAVILGSSVFLLAAGTIAFVGLWTAPAPSAPPAGAPA